MGGEHCDSAPLHSANIDFCFKVGRLRHSRGAAPGELLGSEPPPNQRFFIADQEGLAAIDRPAQALPHDDKLCSDFKADEVWHWCWALPWSCCLYSLYMITCQLMCRCLAGQPRARCACLNVTKLQCRTMRLARMAWGCDLCSMT